jgi:hypothetical protein
MFLITPINKATPSAPNPQPNLPVWASWDRGEKYLPIDIHAERGDFQVALGLLREYEFADLNEGTSAVLGFGLLLRDCWSAVEIEDDDEISPEFLRTSLLGLKQVNQVIKVIKEVTSRLPSPNANKKLEGQGPARTQVPSTSKPSGTGKDDGVPVRQPRSQRQRKPSKKLRDSD